MLVILRPAMSEALTPACSAAMCMRVSDVVSISRYTLSVALVFCERMKGALISMTLSSSSRMEMPHALLGQNSGPSTVGDLNLVPHSGQRRIHWAIIDTATVAG